MLVNFRVVGDALAVPDYNEPVDLVDARGGGEEIQLEVPRRSRSPVVVFFGRFGISIWNGGRTATSP